jgi:hypothetical protein
MFLISSSYNEIKIWKSSDFSLVKTFFKKENDVESVVAFSPDSQYILAIN